jgi:hypothetical protein
MALCLKKVSDSVQDFALRRSIILFNFYIIGAVYYICHFGDPGVDGRIIIRWIFKNWDVGVWTRSSWLRVGTGGEQL